jgi:hypothetical protein
VEDLSIVELWREFFVMSATLFVLERVSSEGVIVRDKWSRALVSFPIFKRQLGVAQICEEHPTDEMVAAMATYVRQVARNWRLIDP